MKKMGASEFKAHCLSALEEVYRKRGKIVITKRGKPIAEVHPYPQKQATPYYPLQGAILLEEDIIAPTGEAWEADPV